MLFSISAANSSSALACSLQMLAFCCTGQEAVSFLHNALWCPVYRLADVHGHKQKKLSRRALTELMLDFLLFIFLFFGSKDNC